MAYSLTANGTATGTYEDSREETSEPVPVVGSRLHPAETATGSDLGAGQRFVAGIRLLKTIAPDYRVALLVVAMAALARHRDVWLRRPSNADAGSLHVYAQAQRPFRAIRNPRITENTSATVTVPAGIVTKSTN